jgi:glutathione S-transferase
MALVLHTGSGSPYGWRVQLALGAKGLAHEVRMLSFSAGDTKKPGFARLNPRRRVPVLVDGEFVLYESNAIVEYLDEAYPTSGLRLFPGDARMRATVRRLVGEVDAYTDKSTDDVIDQVIYTHADARDAAKLEAGRAKVTEELAFMANYLAGDFLAGPLSAADFALYPVVAFLDRCHQREPWFDATSLFPPALAAWKRRIEALPYFAATWPSHWKSA